MWPQWLESALRVRNRCGFPRHAMCECPCCQAKLPSTLECFCSPITLKKRTQKPIPSELLVRPRKCVKQFELVSALVLACTALDVSLTLGFTSATSCVWEIMPFIFAVVSSPLPSHPVISITMLGVTFPACSWRIRHLYATCSVRASLPKPADMWQRTYGRGWWYQ